MLKERQRFAPLSGAQNPFSGTAHNVTAPEMLYVSGSSGGQFDERARQLQGTSDVVSAIVENAQGQEKVAGLADVQVMPE